ncbi:MAG: undecaprenyl diphosphate synthase [Parasphingorhabdus sp.]
MDENDGVRLKVKQTELPRHVAMIMDGNGRWARQQNKARISGHKKGVDVVRDMVSICGNIGIPYLTLFAFSSENWRRPQSEVSFLVELLISTLESEVRKLHENQVNLRIIGDIGKFGSRAKLLMKNAEQLTVRNSKLTLTIAINYGGRWDVAQACQKLAEQVKKGVVKPEDITEDSIDSYLSTHGIPEPDLFIRTGGETRVSNFLLWQLAYTELYFTETLWPDFNQNCLTQALDSYASRQRRFGKTGEQVSAGV